MESAAVLLVLPPGVAHAAKRVALVIGNAHYSHVPELENPKNDAEDMAEYFFLLVHFARTALADGGRTIFAWVY